MSRRPLRPSPPTPPLSPLLGQPGYLIPEEKLPLANHMLKVTAFVGAEQVGSGEVNVPTCKLTAISSLIRESVCFYKGPSLCTFCVCTCTCAMDHSSVCLSAYEAHTSSRVLGDCRLFLLLELQGVAVSSVALCRWLPLGFWFCSV